MPERSVSSSRQFVVYGLDAASRGAIAELAEKTKTNLLSLLRRTDDWQTPIVINLQQPQTNAPETAPAVLRFSQTGVGLKLQLDFQIAKTDAAKIEQELLRASLLEIIYRHHPQTAVGTLYAEPPAWLLDGIIALTPGRDPTLLVQALGVAKKVVPLETFFREDPALFDSPAEQLYFAQSYSLMRLLLDGENGHARLARYIDNLSGASSDPLSDLRKYFPQLAGEDAEKTWKSNIARLSAEQNYQLLTFAETDSRLDELNSNQIEQVLRTKLSPVEKATATQLSRDLLMLAARANPALRGIVQEYQRTAAQLAAGKRLGVSSRFARAKTERAKLVSRMSEIDDYMNWCEATQLTTSSGVFADYLKAANESGRAAPHRTDSLSVYLDALDEDF